MYEFTFFLKHFHTFALKKQHENLYILGLQWPFIIIL